MLRQSFIEHEAYQQGKTSRSTSPTDLPVFAPDLLYGSWESQLRSSCLCCKHCTNVAISLALTDFLSAFFSRRCIDMTYEEMSWKETIPNLWSLASICFVLKCLLCLEMESFPYNTFANPKHYGVITYVLNA